MELIVERNSLSMNSVRNASIKTMSPYFVGRIIGKMASYLALILILPFFTLGRNNWRRHHRFVTGVFRQHVLSGDLSGFGSRFLHVFVFLFLMSHEIQFRVEHDWR